MELILIAAIADIKGRRIIGNKGEIPWYIPEDSKRFKELTMGHPVIMGRVTAESIIRRLGRPLDKRINLVVSSSHAIEERENLIVCKDIFDAIEKASQCNHIAYVAGGARIYQQTILMPQAKKLEITEVRENYKGDAYFPPIDFNIWKEIGRDKKQSFDFVTYIKNIR